MAVKTQSKTTPSVVVKASQDFRKTASGVKLAKIIFNPDLINKITPTQITRLMRDAGLNVPPSVLIAADTAQIIMAGGAIVSDIEMGKDIKAFMSPSAAAISAAADILVVAGLVDKNAPAMQMIQFGADLAMVIGSGGLNVFADIALALDIVKQVFQVSGPPDLTEAYHNYTVAMANKGLRDMFMAREKLQQYKMAADFKDYQSGQFSVFEMLGHVAEDAPDLFTNYFPQFKGFMPPMTMTLIYSYAFHGENRGGLFGLSTRNYDFKETVSMTFESIMNDRQSVQGGLVDYFLLGPTRAYLNNFNNILMALQKYGFPKKAEAIGVKYHDVPVPRIKIQDLALLSMMPPYFEYLHDDFDIKPYLLSAGLTPFNLGYSVLRDQLQYGDFGRVMKKSSAITFNGVDYFTNADQRYNDAVAQNLNPSAIEKYDLSGSVGNLLANPVAAQIITEWGLMPAYMGEEGSVSDADYYSKQGYRNIRNFWGALSLAEVMQKDRYFAGYEVQDKIYSYMGNIGELSEKHRKLQWISVGKKLNQMARANLASLLGLNPSKMVFNPIEPGKPVTIKT